jgi:hypothetical protein
MIVFPGRVAARILRACQIFEAASERAAALAEISTLFAPTIF